MKLKTLQVIFVFFIVILFLDLQVTFSQPSKTGGNMYTQWKKLALVGKNQSEIEYYFRNESEDSIKGVKLRIRMAVLESLRRAGLHTMIAEASDQDDINVVIKRIIVEIRYAGMEHDKDLLQSIKEEFGVEVDESYL